MKQNSRSYLLILMVLPFYMQAQAPNKKISNAIPPVPKLVVGIVVDQMRYDYVFKYWNKFGEGGFKKLMNEGFFCKNTRYNYVPTYTGPGHASIYTGTTPAVNGIISNDWYRKTDNDTMYCVADDSTKTIGSETVAGKMSPKNLLTTTVTDELRYGSNYKNKVIGISLKDRGAILPAGHSANAAYWFDGANGKFISSSYYMNALPKWASDFNDSKRSDSYLAKSWTTLLPIEKYTESTADLVPYEEPYLGETTPVFPHDFPKIRQTNYELIKRSPWGNSILKEFALAALQNEGLGLNGTTDFLTISFSSTDYVGHQFGCNAIETEDTYLRLDQDLADLFSYLEKNIGKDNFLVFLTADHAAIPNPKFLSDHGVPAGLFNSTLIADSLKKFMSLTYGEGDWISCVNDDQVYLNHNLIREKNRDASAVAEKVADFLLKIKGVANAIPSRVFRESEFVLPPLSLLQRGFNARLSGDVLMLLEPGLIEYRSTGTTHGSGYSYDTHVPLFFYGWKIPHGISAESVFITDIAPTLCNWLNIEFPNGCTGKVIPFIIK